MENFELIVRSILNRSDQPAVLILGHFSPQVHETHGFAGPEHWHDVVAQFYDIPHIRCVPATFPSIDLTLSQRQSRAIPRLHGRPILHHKILR